jgi:hypothetical protein
LIVERTDFVSVPVRDMERSKRFYAETLGLPRPNPDILDTGVCHMAFFRDPDGNALMLHRRYAPQ